MYPHRREGPIAFTVNPEERDLLSLAFPWKADAVPYAPKVKRPLMQHLSR
jgi:hypothetical protein